MESILRGTAIYIFLVLLFRITGKRSLAQITTFDFVLLLIISEATQQALLGNDFSITNAVLVVATLATLSTAFDAVKRWSRKADRILEDLPIVIVRDGQPVEKWMKMVNVDTEDVLEAARSRQGLRTMEEIAYAVLERNGEISIIPKQ
jgi:uncharacterized membrane protein YcaP (DUF421 family)